MKVLIVASGEPPSERLLREYAEVSDYIIGVDGGTQVLVEGHLMPHLYVGDSDSIPRHCLNVLGEADVEMVLLNCEKDETDLMVAYHQAVDRGAKHIVILGGLGKRMDHTLGNLQVLVNGCEHGIESLLCDDNTMISPANGKVVINTTPGETISLIPFGGSVVLSNSYGLKYPLNNLTINPNCPVGVSNVATQMCAGFEVVSGIVLIIRNRPTI